MSNSTSVLEDLLKALLDKTPGGLSVRPQLYFKSSLTALSHAMEDQVLAGTDQPLVIANFQRERFYRQEAHRYLRISQHTDQVYVLAAPESEFTHRSDHYETIAFDPEDMLSQEWHLIVIGHHYATCLICRERQGVDAAPPELLAMDQSRRFEGIWTFDRQAACVSADLLLQRILSYRPELAEKIERARSEFLTHDRAASFYNVDPAPFAERLVTYLQAGQYKLLKAYRSISAQERKERLVNSITVAIRKSLNSEEIFKVAVQELGQALGVCRCLVYRCKANDASALIQHEFLGTYATALPSLVGQTWLLQDNCLFQEVVQKQGGVFINDTQSDPRITAHTRKAKALRDLTNRWSITSWLMIPVLNQGRLLGIVELHHCGAVPHEWAEDERALVDAIATQIGTALIQAEAYANLEDLNQQLEALDLTRSNLIAITGHELRTPLSTIQVCLESLSSEPDMPPELRQVMLSSAMEDAERMRKLIQDFLTLSRLESGRVEWRLEALPLEECVELALSSIRTRPTEKTLPRITTQLPAELPLIFADGEWLVEVLSKLLDNACKFTESQGEVTIKAERNGGQMLEVTVADTGRGIEPKRLEVVFDRFYQEEGALRRTAGGTGLGLAICRQIVNGLGGQIWADSGGKDQGSQFHFTVPVVPKEKVSSGKKRK
ncbi:MAG: GAF domain-containing protein [Scytolyngbya sp. HA4215-MV1]|jgi:DICT domain-containing protein/signal transduction histidine kinase|nr:GAF domain-containing protein [Scytolyngbya sp. HA4215-MV1]